MESAQGFLNFVNEARSEFHAVAEARQLLLENDFTEIFERELLQVVPGGKYFFTRNESTLVAFSVGNQYKSGNGFNIIAAHTDSPNFKLKPVTNITKNGFVQIGVQTYGGGLWHTWFDRDLTLAGRVIVKSGDKFESRLVNVKRPIMRIPTLAIHLDRTVNESLKFNNEENLLPIIATTIKSQLGSSDDRHSPVLLELLSSELGVNPEDIQTFDLSVCDAQDAVIGGVHNEFIFSARLDNLMSSYCAIKSLIESSTEESLQAETNCRMAVLYDHEEVGSSSAYGAFSSVTRDALNRVVETFLEDPKMFNTVFSQTMRNSFLISADMAHGLHPNYASKHESNHKPSIHGGIVIKINANQRYATTSETAFIVEAICNQNDIPVQQFVVRNDSPCGSTIGPIVSSKLGIRTVDIGCPQLSMHSIREMCGVDDVEHYLNFMSSFFINFADVDSTLQIN
eukprot:TRINITY_DN8072_c0_g1_i1.p1 TRINITY_DN8072_c0_g1~~TRINITY_DN8072_c0_g1_i1.p1  ORF type:complete len:454 (-),score=84.31 TRINITY_DN8072_c0_g1_i1:14-1375(-)